MDWISDSFIKRLPFNVLIKHLKNGFKDSDIQCPPRKTYSYRNRKNKEVNTFLFMPAWDNRHFFGVKLLTATFANKKNERPFIDGVYFLFDTFDGAPLIAMDAKSLTNLRTAAVSLIATQYLAIKNFSSVLILGNGSLAPSYIDAYASVSHVKKIYLWGRNTRKSEDIIKKKSFSTDIHIAAINDYTEILSEVEVISCITSSKKPLIMKYHLSQGQHFDLVGSFTPEMREVSTGVITSCSVYTDNLDVTPYHAGELVRARDEDSFSESNIQGDLDHLCKEDSYQRKTPEENTLFKATGMALSDLVLASLIYKDYEQRYK